MFFNPWTFLFEVLNFLVLVIILKRLVYDPLHRAIDARRAAIAREEAAAEEAHQQALTMQQQLVAELAAIERQRERMLQQAHETIAEERARAQAAFAEDTARQRAATERDLADLRQRAVAELREDLVKMSVEVVERLLREIADTTLHQQLCHHLVAELQDDAGGASPPALTGPADGASVVIEAGQEIDSATLDQLTTAVSARLGRAISPQVQSNPGLIAGARLQIGGQVWDASLAGLLDESKAALRKEVRNGATRDPAPRGGR
jgi:F-type H+-transporting ATPase subunit b